VLPAFDYARVDTVADALRAAADAGGSAMFLAGGQGLLSELGRGVRRPRRLVDIGGIAELARIDQDGGTVVTGATVRLCDLAARDLPRGLELLARAAANVGSEPIRTQATIGGNLLHGLPTSELTLAAMAAGAEVTAVGLDGEPCVLVDLADLRPRADVSPFLLTGIRWPVPPDDVAVGVDVVEVGEQGGWLPALAIATVVHARAGAIVHARSAVGLRDGRKLVLGPDDEPEGTAFPADWIATHVADSVARAAADAGDAGVSA
jgi:CO/xanthine dehydrogenase FAD-binding subunit